MSLAVAVGKSEAPASTGQVQLISGLSFQPKAVLFFANQQAADGSGAHRYQMLGCATGDGSQMWSGLIKGNNAVSGTAAVAFETRAAGTAKKCIYQTAIGGSGVELDAFWVQWETDGVSVNFRTTTSGRDIHWIALGGDDLTNAFAGNSQAPGSATTKVVTGVGFRPDFVLVLQMPGTLESTANQAQAFMGIGVAASVSQRASLSIGDRSAVNPARVSGALVSDAVAFRHNELDNEAQRADFVSFDSDGFTLNYTVSIAADRFMYLCLKGGRYEVGVDTSPAGGTPPVLKTTTTAFTPKGVLLFGNSLVASAARQDESRSAFGAVSGPSARSCIWTGVTEVDDGNRGQNSDTTGVLKHFTPGDATPTLDEKADLSAFLGNGFRLSWNPVHADAKQFAYVAFGNSAPADVPVPGIQRRVLRSQFRM